MKSVRENEANRFLLRADLVTPGKVNVSDSDIKMVEVNGAFIHDKYEKNLIEQFACNVQH